MKLIIKYLDEEQKYPIVFDINVIDEMQDEYGSIDKWQKKLEEGNLKCVKKTFTSAINEAYDILGKDETVTEKQVGRLLTEIDYQKAFIVLTGLVGESVDGGEEGKNE